MAGAEKAIDKPREVVFVGESDERDIVISGGSMRARRGEPIRVPADLAKRLLEQDVWETPKGEKEKD
jgi:hypothetical protein